MIYTVNSLTIAAEKSTTHANASSVRRMVYGAVLTGLFSTSEGLFYGAGAGFLGAQIFGAVIVGLWAAGMGFIIFKVLDKIHGLRVPARVEEEGLDIYEHGESAYN